MSIKNDFAKTIAPIVPGGNFPTVLAEDIGVINVTEDTDDIDIQNAQRLDEKLGDMDGAIVTLEKAVTEATADKLGTVKSAGRFNGDLSNKEANVYVKEGGTMYADINESNLDLDGYVTDGTLEETKNELIQKIETARPPLATAYEAGIVKSAEESLSIPMTIDISSQSGDNYPVEPSNKGLILKKGTYRCEIQDGNGVGKGDILTFTSISTTPEGDHWSHELTLSSEITIDSEIVLDDYSIILTTSTADPEDFTLHLITPKESNKANVYIKEDGTMYADPDLSSYATKTQLNEAKNYLSTNLANEIKGYTHTKPYDASSESQPQTQITIQSEVGSYIHFNDPDDFQTPRGIEIKAGVSDLILKEEEGYGVLHGAATIKTNKTSLQLKDLNKEDSETGEIVLRIPEDGTVKIIKTVDGEDGEDTDILKTFKDLNDKIDDVSNNIDQISADWNAKEDEGGHIANKPHINGDANQNIIEGSTNKSNGIQAHGITASALTDIGSGYKFYLGEADGINSSNAYPVFVTNNSGRNQIYQLQRISAFDGMIFSADEEEDISWIGQSDSISIYIYPDNPNLLDYQKYFGFESITITTTNSHVGGMNSTVVGVASFVHGNGLQGNANAQAIFGKYNELKDGLLFAIGDGTEDKKHNAFEVTSQTIIANGRDVLQSIDDLNHKVDEEMTRLQSDWEIIDEEDPGYIKNKPNMNPGEAALSLQQETSQAISEGAVAFGKENFAGLKSFEIIEWDDENETYALNTSIPFGLREELIGKEFSIQVRLIYYRHGVVTEISNSGKTIKVDNYVKIQAEYNKDPKVVKRIWFTDYPTLGDTDEGEFAFAAGSNNQATHYAATALGYGNKALGKYSAALGRETEAHYAALAAGYDTHAIAEEAIALGYSSTASAHRSAVIGQGLKATQTNQIVVGKFNEEDPNALFVVGNGTKDTERSNALVVDYNGEVRTSFEPKTDKSVVNKGYVDESLGALSEETKERLSCLENGHPLLHSFSNKITLPNIQGNQVWINRIIGDTKISFKNIANPQNIFARSGDSSCTIEGNQIHVLYNEEKTGKNIFAFGIKLKCTPNSIYHLQLEQFGSVDRVYFYNKSLGITSNKVNVINLKDNSTKDFILFSDGYINFQIPEGLTLFEDTLIIGFYSKYTSRKSEEWLSNLMITSGSYSRKLDYEPYYIPCGAVTKVYSSLGGTVDLSDVLPNLPGYGYKGNILHLDKQLYEYTTLDGFTYQEPTKIDLTSCQYSYVNYSIVAKSQGTITFDTLYNTFPHTIIEYISSSAVIDELTSHDKTVALSANMGRELNDKIANLGEELQEKTWGYHGTQLSTEEDRYIIRVGSDAATNLVITEESISINGEQEIATQKFVNNTLNNRFSCYSEVSEIDSVPLIQPNVAIKTAEWVEIDGKQGILIGSKDTLGVNLLAESVMKNGSEIITQDNISEHIPTIKNLAEGDGKTVKFSIGDQTFSHELTLPADASLSIEPAHGSKLGTVRQPDEGEEQVGDVNITNGVINIKSNKPTVERVFEKTASISVIEGETEKTFTTEELANDNTFEFDMDVEIVEATITAFRDLVDDTGNQDFQSHDEEVLISCHPASIEFDVWNVSVYEISSEYNNGKWQEVENPVELNRYGDYSLGDGDLLQWSKHYYDEQGLHIPITYNGIEHANVSCRIRYQASDKWSETEEINKPEEAFTSDINNGQPVVAIKESYIENYQTSETPEIETIEVQSVDIKVNLICNIGGNLNTQNSTPYFNNIALTNIMPIYSDAIKPSTDDSYTLGSSNKRWKEIYATKGVINTSDRNEKNSIITLDNRYSDFFYNLKPISFKFNSNETEVHIGFIAQDVEEAAKKAGIDVKSLALINVGKTADGKEIYGLRYEEFIAMNTNEIHKLNNRIEHLEKVIEQLLSNK